MTIIDDLAVDLPDGSHGDCVIEHFEVTRDSLENIRLMFQPGGRGCTPGTYTRLIRNATLWMSDTTAERRDHIGPALAIRSNGGRVLIGGLGLGMIARFALLQPNVTHVDVVEIEEDVIELVGPTLQKLAEERGKTLVIHHADLFGIKWPPGTRWNVAWFDIWPTLCEDNLEEMAKLRRSYGRRTDWNDCWGRELLLAERRRTRDAWWR